MITPAALLLICVAATAAAVAGYAIADARRRASLRGLASVSEMHFSPHDRFNLTADVARRFPVLGAAQPMVSDLLYCRRDDRYFYVFRFDYTIGALGPLRRRRAVAGFSEPKDNSADKESPLIVAPSELPMQQQYEHVLQQLRASADQGPSSLKPILSVT